MEERRIIKYHTLATKLRLYATGTIFWIGTIVGLVFIFFGLFTTTTSWFEFMPKLFTPPDIGPLTEWEYFQVLIGQMPFVSGVFLFLFGGICILSVRTLKADLVRLDFGLRLQELGVAFSEANRVLYEDYSGIKASVSSDEKRREDLILNRKDLSTRMSQLVTAIAEAEDFAQSGLHPKYLERLRAKARVVQNELVAAELDFDLLKEKLDEIGLLYEEIENRGNNVGILRGGYQRQLNDLVSQASKLGISIEGLGDGEEPAQSVDIGRK